MSGFIRKLTKKSGFKLTVIKVEMITPSKQRARNKKCVKLVFDVGSKQLAPGIREYLSSCKNGKKTTT